MKIRKDGISFTLTESDLKNIVEKQMLNEGETAYSVGYVEKIENIMKALERVINSEVGEPHEELRELLPNSEVTKEMDSAKQFLLKTIENLRGKVKNKRKNDREKNESKKHSKVLNTLSESQVRKLKRFVK
jgi:hypothetical protein